METRKLTVFYDGSCPLCRREIGFYRRRRGADRISWYDVSKTGSADIAPGLTRDAAMARFHVQQPDGELLSGGDAFRALWCGIPRLRFLAAPLGLPGFCWLVNKAYDVFLGVRPTLQRAVRGSDERTTAETRMKR